jgi:hypothetical protein
MVAPGMGSRPPVTTRSGSPAAWDSTVWTRRHEGGGRQVGARLEEKGTAAPDDTSLRGRGP